MRAFITVCILLLMSLSFPLMAGDEFCGGIHNTAFLPGEQLTFRVFYTVLGAYAPGGDATFTTSLERYQGKIVYHVVGEGKTNSFYDKLFKVRDRYESFFDTATLQPYRFIRNVNEGGYKTFEDVTFFKATNTAITKKGVY